MAEKKKPFDLGNTLADILGSVPGSDTGREQISYLDINVLDADKENFYSMEGLDELAANIELVGLQQPLRVRENPGMPGRYLIVSGHRRRAALWTLYQEEPERWGAVPCIVEPAAASEELQQLRLIYANAGTRQMSSADLARQAEQVERLLYELKEQGYEFPGRMRDHVAEACRVSKTKLATLKVIREKLIPELRQLWEAGKLRETCAYRLAQEEEAVQLRITELKDAPKISAAQEWMLTDWINALHGCAAISCPDDGTPCPHRAVREEQALANGNPCKCNCCIHCWMLYRCEVCCDKAKSKKAQQMEKKEREAAVLDREREKAKAEREKFQAEERERGRAAWARIRDAAAAAGITPGEVAAVIDECDPEEIEDDDIAELERRWNGCPKESDLGYDTDPFNFCMSPEFVIALADLLHCSADYLLGRSPELTPAPAAPAAEPLQFRSGHPDHDAVCWCIFEYGNGESGCSGAIWKNESWNFYTIGATIDAECIGWIELPDYEGVLRK